MSLLKVVVQLGRPVPDGWLQRQNEFFHQGIVAPIKQIEKGVKRRPKLPLKLFKWEGYLFDLNSFFEIVDLQDIQKKKIHAVAISDISTHVRGMRGTNYFYCVMEATGLTTAHAMDQKFSPKLYSPRGEEGNPSRSKQWAGYQKGRLPRKRMRKEVEKLSGYSFEHEVDSLVWEWLDIKKPLPRNTLDLIRKMQLNDSGETYSVLCRLKSSEECDVAILQLGEKLCGYPSLEKFGVFVMLFRTAVEKAQFQSSGLIFDQLVRMLALISGQLHKRGIFARMCRFVNDHLLPLGGLRDALNLEELAKICALLFFLSSFELTRYKKRFWTYESLATNLHLNTRDMGSGFAEIFPVLFPGGGEQGAQALGPKRDQALENFATFLETGNFPLVLHENYFYVNCDCRDLPSVEAKEISRVVRSLKSLSPNIPKNPLDAEVLRFPWARG